MGVITPKILLRFSSRIKPCLVHGVTHRAATPSERQKTRCFKDFSKKRATAEKIFGRLDTFPAL